MSNLGLIISVFVTSLIVFVESQSQQKCSMSEECGKGCCFQSSCTTNKILCTLIKKKSKYERRCFVDQDCSGGCCIDFKCKTKWSYQCIDKNKCTTNSDCDSDCCKDNKCQESSVPCFHFSLPTFNVEDILDTCSTSNDCYTSTKGCCVSGHCGACSPNIPNDYNDNGNSGSSSSSSSSSIGAVTGASIGVGAVIFTVLVILKIAFSYSRARRQRVLVVRRRRVACVEVSVPIVENDELQREHERAEQEIPDCPPPPHSPTAEPGEVDTRNTGQNQDQTEEGQANTREGYGVHQGSPTAPPAYFSSPAANPNENTTQPNLTQMGGMTGNVEEMNGVPQASAMVPPPAYSPSPAANPNENITGQNSAQPEQKTSGYQ